MYLNVSECSGNGKLYVFLGVINWLAFQKLGIWNMKKRTWRKIKDCNVQFYLLFSHSHFTITNFGNILKFLIFIYSFTVFIPSQIFAINCWQLFLLFLKRVFSWLYIYILSYFQTKPPTQITRMYSSMMDTARCSARPRRGVCSRGRGCLLGGVYTSPLWTESQTGVKHYPPATSCAHGNKFMQQHVFTSMVPVVPDMSMLLESQAPPWMFNWATLPPE